MKIGSVWKNVVCILYMCGSILRIIHQGMASFSTALGIVFNSEGKELCMRKRVRSHYMSPSWTRY
jgi:hypothetical protein